MYSRNALWSDDDGEDDEDEDEDDDNDTTIENTDRLVNQSYKTSSITAVAI